MTHGVVEYPSSTRATLPYILHYGIDFNIGDSYNWNKMVRTRTTGTSSQPTQSHPRTEPKPELGPWFRPNPHQMCDLAKFQ